MNDYTSYEEKVSDKIKELTEGCEAGAILKILCNLSSEIIARIGIDSTIEGKDIVEEFRKDLLIGVDLFTQTFKEMAH